MPRFAGFSAPSANALILSGAAIAVMGGVFVVAAAVPTAGITIRGGVLPGRAG